jgi:hypothetical protein
LEGTFISGTGFVFGDARAAAVPTEGASTAGTVFMLGIARATATPFDGKVNASAAFMFSDTLAAGGGLGSPSAPRRCDVEAFGASFRLPVFVSPPAAAPLFGVKTFGAGSSVGVVSPPATALGFCLVAFSAGSTFCVSSCRLQLLCPSVRQLSALAQASACTSRRLQLLCPSVWRLTALPEASVDMFSRLQLLLLKRRLSAQAYASMERGPLPAAPPEAAASAVFMFAHARAVFLVGASALYLCLATRVQLRFL